MQDYLIQTEAPLYFVYLAIGLAAGLMFYLVWLTWQRPNRKHLTWRIICTVLAVISLALLALKPQLRQNIPRQEAILLTEGASQDSLIKLLDFYQTPPVIFTLDSAVLRDFSARKVQLLPDLNFLRRNYPQITDIHLLGAGLPKFELEILNSLQIRSHLTLPLEGLTATSWKKKITLGESLHIQGSFQNTTNQIAKIILLGFDQKLDSVQIVSKERLDFELQTLPKATGRYVYQLQVYNGTTLVGEEKIPVEIDTVSPLRLLILESSPSFEVKFLKNWLAQGKNSVILRTSISRNKYHTEFLNTEKRDIPFLSASVLQNFDIIVADEKSLENLNETEKKALQQTIHAQGLGLLILWKTSQVNQKKSDKFLSSFKIISMAEAKLIRAKPIWQGATTAYETTLLPLAIDYTPSTQPWVQDQSGKLFVSATQQGRGKIALSILNSTYTWALEGHQPHFANYWTNLLNKLTVEKKSSNYWQVDTHLPIAGQPVQFTLHKKTSQVPAGMIQGIPIYLKQDFFIRNQWEGTYWPDTTGWLAVSAQETTQQWKYIYSPSDWKNTQLQQNIEATRKYIALHSSQARQKTASVQPAYLPIPLLYFFLIFICSTGFLWLEKKL